MTRKRILFLAHRVPYPPNRGDRIRSYNLLKFLAERADVWLGCLADETVSNDTLSQLQALCREVHISSLSPILRWLRGAWTMATGGAITDGLFRSQTLRQAVSTSARSAPFDSVVAVCSSMAWYVDVPQLSDVPLVIDLIDVDSEKWFQLAQQPAIPKRQILQLEGHRVRQLERRLGNQARTVTLVSEAEAELYRSIAPNATVRGIPNGVDLHYFSPPSDDDASSHDCVFVGVLDYPPNVEGVLWFASKVWPQVRAKHSKARFVIVGRHPVSAIRHLSDTNSSICLAADVPDVRPYVRQAGCIVAPLRVARGIQNKVLEAMAMGRAVVVSPEARTGLDAQPGQHLLEANSPSEWIESIDRILTDPPCRQALQSAARGFVEQHHNWSTCLSPFAELLGLTSAPSQPSLQETKLVRCQS